MKLAGHLVRHPEEAARDRALGTPLEREGSYNLFFDPVRLKMQLTVLRALGRLR